MRLSLFCHRGVIHFSFEGRTQQLTRNGQVDWVEIPRLNVSVRLIHGEQLIEFLVLEDSRFHGYFDTYGLQAVHVSAFMRPPTTITGTDDTCHFEGPARIGLKECAHQPDLSRGLLVHIFTMAGANNTPVMIDFTVFVAWN